MIAIANAPCSWGVLEFDARAAGADSTSPAYAQVLDEIKASGYAGTELGPYGFLPTDPDALRRQLACRRLGLAGAFVPARLVDPAAHESARDHALVIARLLAAAAPTDLDQPPPLLVLSDDNATVERRLQRAGRITADEGLSAGAWATFAAGVTLVATAVRDATGLRTVVHHHCAGYIETLAEIAELLGRTDPELVGLCLDTGHARYGGVDPADLLDRYADRVWHVHFKDCNPLVAARARENGSDYFAALRAGVFCALGAGDVDVAAILAALRASGYRGWIVVEQDLVAGGTPLDSALRNRQYLRTLGV